MKKTRILVVWASLLLISCGQEEQKEQKKPAKNFFKEITGIRFTEVRRAFDNEIAFNQYGFQQVPEWKLYFTSPDSVKIYSPKKKKFIHYPVYFDHDSVLNFAREWFRVKLVSTDSLILQLLQVDGRAISRERSNVYMKFYADNYIRNTLHTDAESLKRPTRKDTLFVQSHISQDTVPSDSIRFAARHPAVLQSKNPVISIEKIKPEIDSVNINNTYRSDEYLYPEYRITINNAYKDFHYSFSVIVDKNGKMHFDRFLTVMMPEFEASATRVVKGIIDVYLQRLLEITPGNTLGFPHSSVINLYVKGIKR